MRSWELKFKLNSKSLVYVQIVFVMVMLWFRDVFHFPSAITYVTDLLLVGMLFWSISRNKEIRIFRDTAPQCIIVLLIVTFMVFGAIINAVRPLLVLWGMRNNLRFFIFFFICISCLDVSDVDKLLGVIRKFFWVNLVVCTIQYYVFGLKADFLGGFFGTTKGCNGYLNIFICLCCALFVSDFITSKIKAWTLVACLAAALYMSILAELKVFYFELILLLVFSVILTKPSLKTVMISIIFVLSFAIGAVILFYYDKDSFLVLFDTDTMELYLTGTGYTSSGDLNRFTALDQISKTFFNGNALLMLFGFGLGSCEYSQFAFLQSDFALKYGHLNYRWFTHAWVYLEQGAVGLILLVVFFVSILIYACKRMGSVQRRYMIMAVAFLPTVILGLLYNTAVQVECCYIIAFACAVPYIVMKSPQKLGVDNE